MLPYKQNVGEINRTLDWLRDSILNENREEFDSAPNNLRHHLVELEALILFDRTREERNVARGC